MLKTSQEIAVAWLAIFACLLDVSSGANTRPTVTRAATVPIVASDARDTSIEQSLHKILTKLDEHHSELESSMKDIMRISRRTQREVADLQEDMELILGQMYKPSCQEIAQEQHDVDPGKSNPASSGVFTIKPPKFRPTKVRCEIERGAVGWTVMLARSGGMEPFNRTYKEYEEGFGDPIGDYWIGNDFLHKLTTWRPHQLRVMMEDWDGQKTWVHYNRFSVAGPDDRYQLTVEEYEADSATEDGFQIHNGMSFSTYDKDDDNNRDGNCAQLFGGGGGWWYNNCYHVLPTGQYRRSGGNAYGGIAWHPFRGVKYSLKSITMLLRRRGL